MFTSRHSVLRNRNGFTLIEIAIVLVIVGLLLAGVLKGQAMIESTKIRALHKQSDELQAAVNQYQDRYGALPGDDRLAATRLATSGCTADQIANGDGSGTIDLATNERYTVFSHLACAGLLSGSFDGKTTSMTHRYGGAMALYTAIVGTKTGLAVRFANLPSDIAQTLDTNYDDSTYSSGNIRSAVDYASANPVAYTFVFF